MRRRNIMKGGLRSSGAASPDGRCASTPAGESFEANIVRRVELTFSREGPVVGATYAFSLGPLFGASLSFVFAPRSGGVRLEGASIAARAERRERLIASRSCT